ncbi:hypothetical protein TRAPUB_8191 [Trametes pubescens]|uniref:YDG domain-containing protein n=1 Tax=Trametes pubescens TaxID=154538 RepID=A0A1M2W5Z8_TRAPU|nr:hypothetical protein TRAPUB_8191 [Trametes pubescens]
MKDTNCEYKTFPYFSNNGKAAPVRLPPASGRVVAAPRLHALQLVSAQTKKPVRVVRGYKSSSDFAPVEGYRYDGLYIVESAWMDVGKSGFQVCKYSLKVCMCISTPLQDYTILICNIDQRLPDQPPIPRRQGTLNLDLSEWEQPKHFGKEDGDSSNDESSPAPTRRAKKGTATAIPLTQSGWPLIRRPKDSDSEDEDEEDDNAWSDNTEGPPSRSKSPPTRKALPEKPTVAAAIPPTTNVALAGRKLSIAAAAQAAQPAAAPQPDVHALLAEWAGSAMKR